MPPQPSPHHELKQWVHILQPCPPPPPRGWQQLAELTAAHGAAGAARVMAPAHDLPPPGGPLITPPPDSLPYAHSNPQPALRRCMVCASCSLMYDQKAAALYPCAPCFMPGLLALPAAGKGELGRGPNLLRPQEPSLAAWLGALFLFLRAGRRQLAAQQQRQMGGNHRHTPPPGGSLYSTSSTSSDIRSSASSGMDEQLPDSSSGSSSSSDWGDSDWAAPPPAPFQSPPVSLSRYDLHHAHIFLAGPEPGSPPDSIWAPAAGQAGRWAPAGAAARPELGLLFHAAEYPQRSEHFPYYLGFCQVSTELLCALVACPQTPLEG